MTSATSARTGSMRIEEPLPMFPRRTATTVPPVTALEATFPGAAISQLAEVESWRKEIHRPATHTHKWWAQRLGTVFRGIVVSATATAGEDALAAYQAATSLEGLTVFDPFAGSGTTLVEAAKTGASVIGFDINPVASLVQRQALASWDEGRLSAAYKSVEAACRSEIDALHRDSNGDPVLYYFWVASAECLTCDVDVELFSTPIFARHAYSRKFPEAKATCPNCHDVVPVNLSTDSTGRCGSCGVELSLDGPVKGQMMVCPHGHRHRVIDALRNRKPEHRMYAKLVLRQSGKTYQPIDDFDRSLYAEAAERLAASGDQLIQPVGALENGYNTVQAMRWGYRAWSDFFNDRQLYSLGLLATAIRDLESAGPEREALAALFSGTLEFNNLFCSYKGEGTGAVRHMFSHHVLKPERTPLEAHPWGTPASSGSFSTLFESRLLRAHQYKVTPVDLVPSGSGRADRVAGLSVPIGRDLDKRDGAVVVTGNSADTRLSNESVDLIVTDPPYMDNVHYSELADFFHAWLTSIRPFADYPMSVSTRTFGEVQDTTAVGFGESIAAVWLECARVLKPSGLLAFTFHQAKIEGWVAVLQALAQAGFVVTSMQPVKAEMSVAAPKHGAKEPSTLDTIVVCRKRGEAVATMGDAPPEAADRARERLAALAEGGIRFGPTDVRSVVRGSVLSLLTRADLQLEPADLVVAANGLAEELVDVFAASDRASALEAPA